MTSGFDLPTTSVSHSGRARRRGLIHLLAAAIMLAGGGVAVASTGGGASPGGSAVQLCYDRFGTTINSKQYAFCRGLQGLATAAAAACRTPGATAGQPGIEEDCGLLDGRRISEGQIAAYQNSWVHRALGLQRGLDAQAPLFESLTLATHNTFNASSYTIPKDGSSPQYYATLTNQDPNQVYSITDQLNMDIRGIEIDLHWVPSLYGNAASGGYAVTVCHGQSTPVPGTPINFHVGCSADRPARDALLEVRRWLDAHPSEFLLIYLENQLDGNLAGHQTAAALLSQTLGNLVYRPPATLAAGTCADLPYNSSRAQLTAGGARVLLVGNCGRGNWNRFVFQRGATWNEGGNATTYGAADCAADQAAHEAHSTYRRWYEESPFLEAATGASQTLTASATAAMIRCGANLLGWDQLTPTDGRLAASVWSWAPNQPAATGDCAFASANGRFYASDCGRTRHFACVDGHHDWHVTKAKGSWIAGRTLCRREFGAGSSFGVPPNGYRNAQLQAARPTAKSSVWLAYQRSGSTWLPTPAG